MPTAPESLEGLRGALAGLVKPEQPGVVVQAEHQCVDLERELGGIGVAAQVPFRHGLRDGLLQSAAPFGLIGLNLGLRLGAQGAVAAANLLFMAFAMLGGLWIPLSLLPPWMTRLAWILPSFHLGQLSLGLAGLLALKDAVAHLAVLLGLCVIAVVGAWAAWRREEA